MAGEDSPNRRHISTYSKLSFPQNAEELICSFFHNLSPLFAKIEMKAKLLVEAICTSLHRGTYRNIECSTPFTLKLGIIIVNCILIKILSNNLLNLACYKSDWRTETSNVMHDLMAYTKSTFLRLRK